jgi:hypothetical protein
MYEMMERLNVDAAALARANQGDDYMQARIRCLTCGTSDKCLRWLDANPAPNRLPDFCLNRRAFDRFRRQTDPDRK